MHGRIYNKLEERTGNSQFGFRNGLWSREALFGIHVLIQRCRNVKQNVFLCSIDFKKAFDKVRYDNLLEILKTTTIDNKDIRIIVNLYWHQTAEVRLEYQLSDKIKIKRGVRQGFILSPLLFNLYSEVIFNDAFAGTTEEIDVNGVNINNIRYADDTLITNNEKDLKKLMDKTTDTCTEFGLRLNANKTKYMIMSKEYNLEDVSR